MDRREIQQHVFDTLGIILVDKDPIQDDALLADLELDEEDFAEFFSHLQAEFGIVMPGKVKSQISHLPEHSPYRQLTLQGLVDLILVQMKGRKSH
ncbi:MULTISPECIES: hypothetical protein [unclassified Pseudomonas]|uniref:hypothetical protein n=1 Tax=unclassified Pseudomonas TaxID=196821 RepID=UPI00384F18AB